MPTTDILALLDEGDRLEREAAASKGVLSVAWKKYYAFLYANYPSLSAELRKLAAPLPAVESLSLPEQLLSGDEWNSLSVDSQENIYRQRRMLLAELRHHVDRVAWQDAEIVRIAGESAKLAAENEQLRARLAPFLAMRHGFEAKP